MMAWQQDDGIHYVEFHRTNDQGSTVSYLNQALLNDDYPYLAYNKKPSIYTVRETNSDISFVTWQAKKGLSPEKGDGGSETPPAICLRERHYNGWYPLEIFVVENESDRNPVVTAFEGEEEYDYGIAYQEINNEIRYFHRPEGILFAVQTLSEDGVNPAITTIGDVPCVAWTEYQQTHYRVLTAWPEDNNRGKGTDVPHSRLLSFNLQDALSGSHLLNMNADLSLEMADPEIVTPLGNQKLKFSFSHSTLNTQNAFSLQPYLVNTANSRLRIPVNILVQNFSVNKNNLGNGNDLPFWNLRIRNAATNQVLAVVHSYNTGHLTGHHSSNFVLSDTFEVDLSNYLGKNIRLEGVTYLLKNAPHVGLAELYDLRQTAPLEKRTLAVKETQILPAEFRLYPNYPNPFNPSTTISFELPEESRVVLEIYDITGRKIRTLAEGRYPAGTHKIVWDGRDSRGQAVASGVYAYRLQTGKHVTTRKLLLMK